MTVKREKSPRLKDKDTPQERECSEITVTRNIRKCIIRDKIQIDRK